MGDFEQLFRLFDTMRTTHDATSPSGLFPAMNVTEDADAFRVYGELPGIDPKAIDISVANRTLTVSGVRETRNEEGVSYHRRECPDGEFNRSVTLPSDFDSQQVDARYVNGLLLITLPKPEAKRPRQIAVKTV